MVIETFDPKETYDLGVKMGEQARAGQVICLNGDLGVGKTVFTQGFAAGLGIAGPVNSPTSVSYTHLDVYKRQVQYAVPYVLSLGREKGI